MSFGVFGSVFLLTQLLQSLFDFGPFDAGLRMLFWSGATTFVSPLAASLAERFGPRPFMAAGLGLLAVAFVWIAVTASVGRSWIALIPPFVLGGVGNGLAFAPAASAVLAAVATEDTGRASGVNNAIREVGGAFGVAVLATVFAHHGGFASAQDILDGTRPAVLVGAAFVAAGAVAALLYGRVRPAVRPPEAEHATREPSLV
jgi:MFS family permease